MPFGKGSFDPSPAGLSDWPLIFSFSLEDLGTGLMGPFLGKTLKRGDAVVLAVRHQEYKGLSPEKVIKMTGQPAAIVDCFGVLEDAKIRRYFELGCEVKGLGRGHVKRIKDEVRKTKMK